MKDKPFLTRRIKRVLGGEVSDVPDQLALEEPLEIQLTYGPDTARVHKTIAVTMRTPGQDGDLATGFLVGEGLLRDPEQIESVEMRGPHSGKDGWQHIVRVTLRSHVDPDLARLDRNFYTTSSCGVCGKTSIEALGLDSFSLLPPATWQLDRESIQALPARLRESQVVFERTGGLHAAGLFTREGQSLAVREDVGRHNAVDKVIGAQYRDGRGDLSDCVLVVSGRASFELMQKALVAGIPMLIAVGAPSGLAVEVAEKFGATLIGFTKPNGFNIYAGETRVYTGAGEPAIP